MIAIVNLNFNMERIYRLTGLEAGGVYRTVRPFVQAGGKGVNVSRALKTLNEKSVIFGFSGGRMGSWIEKDLKRRKFKIYLSRCSGESRVCIGIYDPENGKQTVLNEPGGSVSGHEFGRFAKTFQSKLRGFKAAVFAGSVPPGISPRRYAGLIKTAKAKTGITIVDTGGEYLVQAVNAAPSAIKVNLEEWETAHGKKLGSVDEIEKSARRALLNGVGCVIITMGSAGFLYFSGEGSYKVSVPKVKVVNAVGCGDAMTAALAKGMVNSWGSRKAARYCAAVSVASALTAVPCMIKAGDVKRIEKNIRITEI